MASDADSLRAAILSLYGMAGLAQEQANSWLNSFSRSPEAWQACMQLLEPSERPEVCFFCANMLLSKVRTDWHKLSAEQQTQIGAVIRWVRSCTRQVPATSATLWRAAVVALNRQGLLRADGVGRCCSLHAAPSSSSL
jgi:hypothetical protein